MFENYVNCKHLFTVFLFPFIFSKKNKENIILISIRSIIPLYLCMFASPMILTKRHTMSTIINFKR